MLGMSSRLSSGTTEEHFSVPAFPVRAMEWSMEWMANVCAARLSLGCDGQRYEKCAMGLVWLGMDGKERCSLD